MEKRIKRIEISLLILITLVVFNTITPFILSDTKIEEKDRKIELPKELSKDTLNKTIYAVKNSFNNSEWINLYNIFGNYAKAQLNSDDVKKEFKKLSTLTGNIGTYAYSHYEYLGNENDADWFDVFFKCSFSNGGNGNIKLRYRVTESTNFEVVGLNINLNEI